MSDLRTAALRARYALALWSTGRDMDAVALNDLIAELDAALEEPDIDPVDEYRKGFIAGQIDMRDRPEEQPEPVQHEYEVTANDDGTFSVELPDGEELRIIQPQRPAAPIIQPEIKADKPFGYFRAEPFGWTDCAPTDEGAIPLYERPKQPPTPPEAQTEAEKIAYCAGWWAALEAERKELLRIAEKQ